MVQLALPSFTILNELPLYLWLLSPALITADLEIERAVLETVYVILLSLIHVSDQLGFDSDAPLFLLHIARIQRPLQLFFFIS